VAEDPNRFFTEWDDVVDAGIPRMIATQDAVILARRGYDEWVGFWPGTSTAAPVPGGHLPTARRRVYPSETSDTEWNLIAGLVPVGGPRPAEAVDPCGTPGGASSMRSAHRLCLIPFRP
jgi:hypothetical protein